MYERCVCGDDKKSGNALCRECEMAKVLEALRAKLTAAESARDAAEARLSRLAACVTIVPFHPADGFPLSDGYMVGKNDGKSVLYPTAREALTALVEQLVQSRAERDALKAQLAALDTEAKALPSAEEIADEIATQVYYDRQTPNSQGWLPFIAAAIEHRDLIHARRAQVRTDGMRKALEECRDFALEVIGTRNSELHGGDCPCGLCEVVKTSSRALADEPADVLDEVLAKLREARGAIYDRPNTAEQAIDDINRLLGATP